MNSGSKPVYIDTPIPFDLLSASTKNPGYLGLLPISNAADTSFVGLKIPGDGNCGLISTALGLLHLIISNKLTLNETTYQPLLISTNNKTAIETIKNRIAFYKTGKDLQGKELKGLRIEQTVEPLEKLLKALQEGQLEHFQQFKDYAFNHNDYYSVLALAIFMAPFLRALSVELAEDPAVKKQYDLGGFNALPPTAKNDGEEMDFGQLNLLASQLGVRFAAYQQDSGKKVISPMDRTAIVSSMDPAIYLYFSPKLGHWDLLLLQKDYLAAPAYLVFDPVAEGAEIEEKQEESKKDAETNAEKTLREKREKEKKELFVQQQKILQEKERLKKEPKATAKKPQEDKKAEPSAATPSTTTAGISSSSSSSATTTNSTPSSTPASTTAPQSSSSANANAASATAPQSQQSSSQAAAPPNKPAAAPVNNTPPPAAPAPKEKEQPAPQGVIPDPASAANKPALPNPQGPAASGAQQAMQASRKKQLEDLIIKLETEIAKLSDDDEKAAGNKVLTTLKTNKDILFSDTSDAQAKKVAFTESFNAVNEAHRTFSFLNRRSIVNVLVNIALFLLGAGVLYLIAAAVHFAKTGRATFFHKPALNKELPEASKELAAIAPEGVNAPQPLPDFKAWSAVRVGG